MAALREFLNSFRLPGESMLIERLFPAWAARLYRSAAALGYARASALENDAASRKTEL